MYVIFKLCFKRWAALRMTLNRKMRNQMDGLGLQKYSKKLQVRATCNKLGDMRFSKVSLMIKVEQFIVCRVNCQECLRCRDRVKWGQSLTSSHYHSAPHWAGAWCLVADIGALPLEGPGAWHGGTTTGMPLLLNAPITCFLPLPFQLTMDDDSCLGRTAWINVEIATQSILKQTELSSSWLWQDADGLAAFKWWRRLLCDQDAQSVARPAISNLAARPNRTATDFVQASCKWSNFDLLLSHSWDW